MPLSPVLRALVRPAGKHVKPSAAPKAAVAGGLTAAFLIGDAGSASAAAPSSEWQRLAQCESGGNWSINTGNGYYGGLQFNLATWRSVGGTGRPDQASRSEQIRRANILHDSRGFSPWPSCSRKLGLRSGPADVEQEAPRSAPEQQAPRPAPEQEADEQPSTRETARATARATERARERASRARRAQAATVVKAVVPITGKYQASSRAKVVVALATVAPPVFDGRVMTADDADVYRLATKVWQRRMAARGWDLDVDGKFGPQSASVAQRFAEQKGLKPAAAGTVDRDVWNAAWALAVS